MMVRQRGPGIGQRRARGVHRAQKEKRDDKHKGKTVSMQILGAGRLLTATVGGYLGCPPRYVQREM